MAKYILPKLPYSYNDLEPFIDTTTMEIHHKKHHQSYVDGLNKTLEKIDAISHPQYITSILSEIASFPKNFQNDIIFFGGGYENHRIFWETMNPKGGDTPGGKLGDSIDVYFNNFENFKRDFSNVAMSVEGSGWCWLIFNTTFHKIEIVKTQNQDNPWLFNKIPLLGLDMWEHAYYLKNQNNRSEYIESWWNVVNWDFVGNRFADLSG